MHMRLREAIREAVGERRQVDVAASLGVSQSKVSRWLSGDTEPTLSEIADLERACGRPAGFIFHAAGMADAVTVSEAIALDPELDDTGRAIVLAAYRAAVKARRR